jgi:hypothetical protein
VTIDEPYPRRPEFRTSPSYARACRELSLALAQAMGGGARAAA